MIAIHFEQVHDCRQLYTQLKKYIQKYAVFGLGGAVEAQGDDTLLLNYEHKYVNFYDSFQPLLTSVLTEYVIQAKEDEWLLDIIEKMFYFTNPEEQKQILSIARAILEGDRQDLPSIQPFFDRRGFIYKAFSKHLEEDMTFYFEAFLTFRLQDYGEMLIDCVEIAIDEYKFEQEYQNMIEGFRQHIQTYLPKMPLVHIVHNESFSFYDKQFREISQQEIVLHLQEKLIFEQGIDVQEMVISPLVSLNPAMVYIFSDDPDNGVILTIQAIFQERMKIFPLNDCENQN